MYFRLKRRAEPVIIAPFHFWFQFSVNASVFFNLLLLLFIQSLTRKDTTASIRGRKAHRASSVRAVLLHPLRLLLSSSPRSCSVRTYRGRRDLFCTFFFVPARDMDLWFYSIRIYWWRVLFLMSIFQDYLSSMLDCPPTCSCSQTEIYCNKSDNDRFFPLLALQDTGSNGTNVDIKELFKNITSMWVDARFLLLLSIPKSFRELKRFQAVCCFIRAGLMKGLLFICSTFFSHLTLSWVASSWQYSRIRNVWMLNALSFALRPGNEAASLQP